MEEVLLNITQPPQLTTVISTCFQVAYPMSFDFTPITERQRLQQLGHLKPHLLGSEYTRLDYPRRPLRKDLGKSMLNRAPRVVCVGTFGPQSVGTDVTLLGCCSGWHPRFWWQF